MSRRVCSVVWLQRRKNANSACESATAQHSVDCKKCSCGDVIAKPYGTRIKSVEAAKAKAAEDAKAAKLAADQKAAAEASKAAAEAKAAAAKADAEKAKADAEKAKADADKAKLDAEAKAKAEAEAKAKAEAEAKAKAEAKPAAAEAPAAEEKSKDAHTLGVQSTPLLRYITMKTPACLRAFSVWVCKQRQTLCVG